MICKYDEAKYLPFYVLLRVSWNYLLMRFRITNSELRLLADEIVKFPPTVYVTEGQSINTSRKNFCKADIKNVFISQHLTHGFWVPHGEIFYFENCLFQVIDGTKYESVGQKRKNRRHDCNIITKCGSHAFLG